MKQRFNHMLICLLMLLASAVSAQQGCVRIFVKPGNDFYVIIDGDTPVQVHMVTLDSGKHDISIWAYGHEIMDTSLTVLAGDTSKAFFVLRKSDEFVAFSEKMEKYNSRKAALQVYPAGLLAVGVVTSGVFFVQQRSRKAEFDAMEINYAESVDPIEILELKQEMESIALKQNKSLSAFQVAWPLTVVAATLTYFGFRKSNKMDRPEYEDKNSVVFKGLSYNNEQGWRLGLAINLK